MRRRNLVVVIVALVVAFGVMLGVVRWVDPVARYRRDHDAASLYVVLNTRIANGDSLEAVEALLGRGAVGDNPTMLKVARKWAAANPAAMPQGVRDEDVFYNYRADGWHMGLQFRDGHLVNHDPSVFAAPPVPFHGLGS